MIRFDLIGGAVERDRQSKLQWFVRQLLICGTSPLVESSFTSADCGTQQA